MKDLLYIDLGANCGKTIDSFLEEYPDAIVHGFEPTPSLSAKLKEKYKDNLNVTIHACAVGIEDGEKDFFINPTDPQSNTLMKNQKCKDYWAVDYQSPIKVKVIDFTEWLKSHIGQYKRIVVKMDIEGAEYEILPKMLLEGLVEACDEMRIEYHRRMYSVSKKEHRDLALAVSEKTNYIPWR